MGVKVGSVTLYDLWARMDHGGYLGKFVPYGEGDQSALIEGLPRDLRLKLKRLRNAEIGVERRPGNRWTARVWIAPGTETLEHDGLRTLAHARERGCHLLLLALGLAKTVPADY